MLLIARQTSLSLLSIPRMFCSLSSVRQVENNNMECLQPKDSLENVTVFFHAGINFNKIAELVKLFLS